MIGFDDFYYTLNQILTNPWIYSGMPAYGEARSAQMAVLKAIDY